MGFAIDDFVRDLRSLMRRITRLLALGRSRTGLVLAATGIFLIACGEDTAGPSNPNAELVLLAPQGNESYHVGDSLQILWKAQGKGLQEISSVTVAMSLDSGATWANLKKDGSATMDAHGLGNFGWRITASFTVKGVPVALPGKKVLIRVQDYQNAADPNRTAIVPAPISIEP
jgi:hypothetical protein